MMQSRISKPAPQLVSISPTFESEFLCVSGFVCFEPNKCFAAAAICILLVGVQQKEITLTPYV